MPSTPVLPPPPNCSAALRLDPCPCPSPLSLPPHPPPPLPSCRYMLELLKRDIKPRDIMTAKAFENAMVTVMATGGSTNAVLHYIAMAR